MQSVSSNSQRRMKADVGSCYSPCRRYFPKYLLVLVLASSVNPERQQCDASPIYSCNVCRNPPQGSRGLINGGKTFGQSNGVTMSCTELQLSVQDVNPTSGAPGEARLCATAQYLAYLNCECSGPAIPNPTDTYKEPNPACDLCGAPGLQFKFVPSPNQDKLTNTRVAGQQNCAGLYKAAAQGVLSANLCPTVQQYSGPDCCNLTVVQPRQAPLPTPAPVPVPTPSPGACLDAFAKCGTTVAAAPPCCAGFECRARVIGDKPICSAISKQPTRDRISGPSNTGGAGAGRPTVRGAP